VSRLRLLGDSGDSPTAADAAFDGDGRVSDSENVAGGGVAVEVEVESDDEDEVAVGRAETEVAGRGGKEEEEEELDVGGAAEGVVVVVALNGRSDVGGSVGCGPRADDGMSSSSETDV
jgi:hypothetical protein